MIKETNATVQYLTLTRTIYEEWEMLMQVNMEARTISRPPLCSPA